MFICTFHGITKRTVCEAVGNIGGHLQFHQDCQPVEMTRENEASWRTIRRLLLEAARGDEFQLRSVPDDPGKSFSRPK